MDTNVITWIFFGVLALFIFFKFKKFLPFKQDARSVNYYHTEHHPITEKVVRELRPARKKLARKKPTRTEPIDDYDDDYDDDYKESTGDDNWSKTLQKDADIAYDMFGVDKEDRL